MSKGIYKHNLFSVEHKEKIRQALLGKIPWNKGLILGPNPAHSKRMMGRKVSEETRRKMSISMKGKNTGKYVGTHRSNETKLKISMSLIGKHNSVEQNRKISEFRKGKVSPSKGKSWSIESRMNFSKKQKGKNSNNWKGGITPINKTIRKSLDFNLWRKAVFARDNYTDQKTGIKGGKLHPHHIQNFAQYPELRFAIDNGITLSEKSHREFHKKYGQQNNTREQLTEFLNSKI